MAKKNTEMVVISPELAKNIQQLESYKVQVSEVVNNCKQIVIVDESTLAICQQNLSKANNLSTAIESLRKKLKAPYKDAGDLIDSTTKSIVGDLPPTIQEMKVKVGEWEKKRIAEEKAKQDEIDRIHAEKVAAEQAEQKRKDEIRDEIAKMTIALNNAYNNATTPELCDAKLHNIETKYKPKEYFAEFGDQAYELRDTYVNLIKAKKQNLLAAGTMSDNQKALAKMKEELSLEKANIAAREAEVKAREEAAEKEKEAKAAELAAEVEKQRLAQEAEANKTRGIRYTWDYEVVDLKQAPEAWIMLDDKAVRQYLKDQKEELKDGGVVNGVRFFKKMGVAS